MEKQAMLRLKQAEDRLKDYAERLEEMVEERTHALQDAQERSVRQEKLAVLGQMAGSVGHELRTPLATISNAVYYLRMVLGDSDEQITEAIRGSALFRKIWTNCLTHCLPLNPQGSGWGRRCVKI